MKNEPSEGIVIDLKPGDKLMSYAMGRAARPGNWLFFLQTTHCRDRPSYPGSEKPIRFQAV